MLTAPTSTRLHLIALTAILVGVIAARSEVLPVRVFTTADGLGSSSVTQVMQDSRGFLWFATRDGLTRFDGEHFRNYHLPGEANPNIIQILQRRNGDYYALPRGLGLFRFNANTTVSYENAGSTLILNAEKIAEETPGLLYEDREGRFWATGRHLSRLDDSNGALVVTPVPLTVPGVGDVGAIRMIQARDGTYWLTTDKGVLRVSAELECLEFYETVAIGRLNDYLNALFEDKDGRIWVGTGGALFAITPRTETSRSEPAIGQLVASENIRSFTSRDGFREDVVRGFTQTDDGMLFIAADGGLSVYDGTTFKNYDTSNGIGKPLSLITVDSAGSLWMGSGTGAYRLSLGGLSSFRVSDGLADNTIDSIYEASDGTIYVANGVWNVSRFDGRGFTTVRPSLDMDADRRPIWTSNVSFLDRSGGWWFLTEDKLFYYENVERIEDVKSNAPTAVYESNAEFFNGAFYRLFEDSSANIWLSIRSSDRSKMGLRRWNRQDRKFETIGADLGFPAGNSPSAFAEDSRGNLWTAFYHGGLARMANGRFEDLSQAPGLPRGGIFSLFTDSAGRIWIASSEGGLGVVDDPSAAQPVFKTYTVADGLSSNNTRTVIEGSDGKIYVGTVRGLDVISPSTGRITHLTTADGLANEFVTTALKTHDGTLWFGTRDGLSRLVAQPERSLPPPPIFIAGLRVAGVEKPISELGQTEVSELDLDHNESNLQVEFLSIGSGLRYQYQLDGADLDWSKPAVERTVNFSNLSPGNYRLMVRAVSRDGSASTVPAILSFSIAPPFWRTWTFYSVSLLLFAGLVFLFDRRRTMRRRERRAAQDAIARANSERLRELEQVRRRIATDLHDDIGSSLTHISILSEVLRQRVEKADTTVADPLGVIAESSRELVDSMSDIVWAINPSKDTVRDLSGRMRRFAADLFTVRDIAFTFAGPAEDLEIGANVRREIFLIFKESIHNIIKHAGCKSVEIELRTDGGNLILEVKDDGRGFDLDDASPHGHGLASIRERAAGIGGDVSIESTNGSGTRLVLNVPLAGPVRQAF